jgi:hypothetical protein
MAKIARNHARTTCFIADDLRRRRPAIDSLLKQVGLEKADLDNPKKLIERA